MNEHMTLRDAFDEVAAGRAANLPEGLDSALIAEALAAYGETAPIEVAEHLQSFTTAVRHGEDPDPAAGLDLLATAPAVPADPADAHDVLPDEPPTTDRAPDEHAAERTDGDDAGQIDDLGFGAGTPANGYDDPSAPSGEAELVDPHDSKDATALGETPGETVGDDLPGIDEDTSTAAADTWWDDALVAPPEPSEQETPDHPSGDG